MVAARPAARGAHRLGHRGLGLGLRRLGGRQPRVAVTFVGDRHAHVGSVFIINVVVVDVSRRPVGPEVVDEIIGAVSVSHPTIVLDPELSTERARRATATETGLPCAYGVSSSAGLLMKREKEKELGGEGEGGKAGRVMQCAQRNI